MNASVPNATLSVAAILAEGAKRHGQLPAITLGGASTSYRDLWDQARAYAGALRDAVARALLLADERLDYLIGALLAQCLDELDRQTQTR